MTSPNNSKVSGSNERVELKILDTFTNDTFQANIDYFKLRQSSLYNTFKEYKCKEFKLCLNPDGSPNIWSIKDNAPVYRTFKFEETLEAVKQGVRYLKHNASIPQNFLERGDAVWRRDNPIQQGMLDSLFECGPFKHLYSPSEKKLNLKAPLEFIPFLRVNGIGLGLHLQEIVREKRISYISIYEPYLDLFYTSLFTAPWHIIFDFFQTKGKGITLQLGVSANTALVNETSFLRQHMLPLTSYFFQLDHFASPEINKKNTEQKKWDGVQRSQSDAGWYEDQRLGFYFSSRNIKMKNKVFTGKTIASFFRTFVIGSGPSLNESIDYIKRYQNDAIIISCGSAISPLLKAGIVPDYEVVQERTWHKMGYEDDLGDVTKEIYLFKLNVVSPKTDSHYKDTFIFQKFRDPGSSLLSDYAVTTAVNPTVTNAGISMSAALGVNEVYLFGVDYGAPVETEKMHADNTIYDDEKYNDTVSKKTDLELEGNFGSIIKTNSVLSWSHETTEVKIAEYPTVKWFNVGEGAKIKGTLALNLKNLPKKFKKKFNKDSIKKEINARFNNNYKSCELLDFIKKEQANQVKEYLDAISGFRNSEPKTREEVIHVLSLLYGAVSTGKNEQSYLPVSLLSYGFMQFINNVYIQSCLFNDDNAAAEFFKKAMKVLDEYSSNISKDFEKIIQYILQESEVDLLTIKR